MAEREILRPLDEDISWAAEASTVLDTYLRKVGIVSADVRSRWVARIVQELQAHIGEIAADDFVEQAVERLRQTIAARLAKVAGLDPSRDGREIAGMLVVLQDVKYADLVSALFADCDAEVAPMVREQLRRAVAAERPRPVPKDALTEFPTQVIQLRSLNPLHWLFRRGR
jgi:acyl transferase domain-containing protein